MNDHNEENPVIPEIPHPILPEPRWIEIWPGVPTDKKPVPLEGPGREVREVNDPQPSHTPQPQTGGSGKGGRGSNLPPAPSYAPKNEDDDAFGAKFPSVDEVSSYWSFRDHKKFGIAVSKKGLYLYAAEVVRKNPAISSEDARLIAEDFIVQHQFHHFLVDRAVATLESVLERERWLPMQQNFSRSRSGFSALEESLSCAYARRQIKSEISKKGFKTLLELQPKGYQLCSGDGKKIKTIGGDATHKQSLSTLLSGYAQKTETPHERSLGLDGLMLYKSHLNGTGGDPYYARAGVKEKIKIYYSA
jgi:hypothetical protein